MGTIAQKLEYLNDTKQAIKNQLNKFGLEITNETTFRSYSNVLSDIYDKLPKISENGSNITLENLQNGKLDLFEIEGNTIQNDDNTAPTPDTPTDFEFVTGILNIFVNDDKYEIQLENKSLAKTEVLFKNIPISEHYDNTLDNDSWYLKKQTRILELPVSSMNNSENYPGWKNIEFLSSDYPGRNQRFSVTTDYLCNIFKLSDNAISINTQGQSTLFIAANSVTQLKQSEWKEQYPNLIFKIIYGLSTPIYEKITDEILITQLEAVSTYKGTNIFNVSSDNGVIPTLNVSRLKELEKLV